MGGHAVKVSATNGLAGALKHSAAHVVVTSEAPMTGTSSLALWEVVVSGVMGRRHGMFGKSMRGRRRRRRRRKRYGVDKG